MKMPDNNTEPREFSLALAFIAAVAAMAIPSMLAMDHYFETLIQAVTMLIERSGG